MKSKSNTSGSILQFSVHLGFRTCLIVRCSIYQALGRSTRIPSQANTVVSIGDEGYIGVQVIWSLEFKFHLWCCSASGTPRQYPGGLMQEQKNRFATGEPGLYPNIVSWIASLRRNPFSSFTLFIFIFSNFFHIFILYVHFS